MSRRPPLIRDHKTALYLGLALTLTGAYVLYDAYEGRGKPRPFFMRWMTAGLG